MKKTAWSLKTRLALGFLKAMKKASNTSMAEKDKRHHAIRAAAYSSMAAAIGPRRAWSRAILRKARTRKLMKKKEGRSRGNPRNDDELGLGIGEELKDLSEVVPGGTAMDSSKLLNETAHYIKCLTLQVQIMTNILHYSQT